MKKVIILMPEAESAILEKIKKMPQKYRILEKKILKVIRDEYRMLKD